MLLTRASASVDLVKFRERHGITQEELSVKANVSKTTIVGIEKNRIKPQAITIYKLNMFIKTLD